jgi:hypothetical protein
MRKAIVALLAAASIGLLPRQVLRRELGLVAEAFMEVAAFTAADLGALG